MKKLVSAALVAALLTTVFSLSACNDTSDVSESSVTVEESSVQPVESSAESSQESSKKEVSKTPISGTQISEMKSYLDSYQNVPEFDWKIEAIHAKSVTNGETITLICDNSSISYNKLVIQQFKEATNTAGFKKVVVANTDGTSASVDKALNTAVNDKSNVIILFGDIDKDAVSTNIEYAQANGIEVISAGCIGVGQQDHFVDYTMPVNYQLLGKCLADWTIVQKSGSANVLAVNCTDSHLSNTVATGFQNEFDKYISNLTGYCTGINAASSEIDNGLANKIKKALQDDPNLNYVVVFSDGMINDAVSAVSQLSKKIPVIATGGSDDAFTAARNGSLEMLAAQSFEWTAYGMTDYAMKVMAKASLPKEQYLPFRIITPESIANDINRFGGLSGNFNLICFGSYFENGYSYTWQG